MSPTHRKREVKKDISGKIKCEKKLRDRKISTYSYVKSRVRTPLWAANMTERDRATRPAQQAGLPPATHLSTAPPSHLLLINRRSAFVFLSSHPSARSAEGRSAGRGVPSLSRAASQPRRRWQSRAAALSSRFLFRPRLLPGTVTSIGIG